MSDYPTWSFRVPLRDDIDPATMRVLDAVARDAAPAEEDLATLHPVVRYYLSDWTHMLTGELPPYVGPPVRLSGLGTTMPTLTIEFSQHDDEQANGGWIMWLWVLRLVARPPEGWVMLVGHQGPSLRTNNDWKPIVVDGEGFDLGGTPRSWEQLEGAWADTADPAAWEGWPGSL